MTDHDRRPGPGIGPGPEPRPRGQWRAVYCKPREEQRAHLHLLNQDYRAFLPLARVRKRNRGRDRSLLEPMFPRYLFVRLADYREDFGPIRSTRGVVGLVRMGDDVPCVPDELIDLLQARCEAGGAIDLTEFERLAEGDEVEITAGPFAGLKGLFHARTGEQRALVLLELLGKPQKLTLPTTDLRKAKG
ncbi:transcription/translation regulatory transformer protein RfaH [Wenzhouxiangella sp. XN79A]|uniref:transcription/translation regulatory transformer protein RfaH n=1 Tax=Wenzhouxiangella sp. XN79A TaxID=2724193 RepID=UPI00144A8D07|nr:transcription/translation regulatory transformer protein RfaH [Wenzhouxiangella sp. XN79A]NKI36415.1 transcription/translation regulatory transformer protein RfaH [Wenzhouxiangella sp. XN79A]